MISVGDLVIIVHGESVNPLHDGWDKTVSNAAGLILEVTNVRVQRPWSCDIQVPEYLVSDRFWVPEDLLIKLYDN